MVAQTPRLKSFEILRMAEPASFNRHPQEIIYVVKIGTLSSSF